jgi:hypothetical protein
MVKVLGKFPGQNTEKPWAVMTKPGGIGETEQMIVNPVVDGTVMVQVLSGEFPGQDTEKPWAVMTNPAGMGEPLQIIVGAALAGAAATAEIAPIVVAVSAAAPRRRRALAARVFVSGRRGRCRTCSN